jgi:hypothetical protein
MFQKSGKAADGEDRLLLQDDKVFCKPTLFGLADKKDLAFVCCRNGRQSPRDELTPLMGFIRNEGIEGFAEAVFSQDADRERCGVLARIGRPADELFKVIKVGCLDLGWSCDHGRLRRAER